MKGKSSKGIGNMSNPNSMSTFSAIKKSAGKSSGNVNANAKATKISAGKTSGKVNKPVPMPKKRMGGGMKRGC
jgi:hypothetical protein